MHIALCSEDKTDEIHLIHPAEKYLRQKAINYSVDFYDSAEKLIYEIGDGERFDIIIADMSRDGGIDRQAVRCIKESATGGKIIIAADTLSFAIFGYEIGARGYLLKPFDSQRICAALDCITADRSPDAYTVRHRNRIVSVPFGDILFIESQNSKCILHREDGSEHNIYKKLDDIEKEIDSPFFLRTHQSFLVNLNRVVKLDGDEFEMADGCKIPVSRRSRAQAKEYYAQFLCK